MTRDEIINYLIDLGFVENYTVKLMQRRDDDIIQDLWVIILQITQDKWDLLQSQGSDTIIKFVSGLIYRQVRSKTSTTYYKYKRHSDHEMIVPDIQWREIDQTI